VGEPIGVTEPPVITLQAFERRSASVVGEPIGVTEPPVIALHQLF
jgi:hypothetical protein